MTKNLLVKLTATKWQQEIINCDARIIGIFAGRRSGKTIGCLRNIGLKHCITKSKFKVLTVAPGYSQSKVEYEDIISNISARKFIKRTQIQPFPKVEFTNGSTWSFRSLDRPHLLRSGGFHLLMIDECQDVSEDVYQRVLRALVADRKGQIILAGQFNGESGWLNQKINIPGQRPNQNKYKSFIIPSTEAPCFKTKLGKEELEDIRQSVTKNVWEQEYLALPIANCKAVFDPKDIDLCTAGNVEQNPEVGCKYVVSLDLGRTVDPNSYVVVKVKPSSSSTNEYTVVESGVRPRGEKHEVGAMVLAQVVKRFGNCLFVADTTGGGSGGHEQQDAHIKFYRNLIPQMRGIGINIHIKHQLIASLDLWLQQHKINIPAAHQELIRQLKLYEFKHSGSGVYTYNAPVGDHDDLVASIAMSIYAIEKNWLLSPYGNNQTMQPWI